ncbi:AI-2E family transporter [Amaricoccus solimangrovi]|uniref:AI-2E family transporter n=1 Tax=Amaricoccus solimangrovi TaxID=2589815 RepID=A0A501WPM8_9RHOB|nr:AI-2E family transporter [Amaricoccus solimangrovi]TPE51409.1 AI-2E family transporter [Amaricoccus solimangrovi]
MRDWFPQLVYGLAFALMVGWILQIGRPVILPVVAGVVVAYVILGLAELLGRLPGLGARIPAGLRYGLAALLIGLVLVGIVWLIVTNVSQIAATLPRYQERVMTIFQAAAERFGFDAEPDWQAVRDDILGRINLRRAVGVTVATASSIAATFVVIVIYAGFILSEKDSFGRKIALLSAEPARVAQIQEVIRDINSSIGAYLVMKTLINVVLGLGSYAIMWWYGIPFAGFWAILIGLFNYIPYVGSFLGVVLPAFLAVAEMGAFWPVVSFVLAMTAIQLLLGNFIEPYVMGSSMNLSPLVILISLVAWASLWGIAGAILSVPITAMLVIIFAEFPGTRPLAILMSKDGTLARPGRAR